jgi:hypothetical protein
VRLLLVILAAGFLAQCASGLDAREVDGDRALVIIGVAETADHRDPRYALLWRLVGEGARFTDYDDTRTFDAQTHSDDSVRVDGIPGEFEIFSVRPGIYALDGAFATLREQGVTYFAQGVIEHPQRPSFEARAGEAVYLGIWQLDIDGANAVTRVWRLDPADLEAARAAAPRRIPDQVALRETAPMAVACAPRRINQMTPRQIC